MKILNELEYVEQRLLKTGFSSYMSFRDLFILAKYYRSYLGKESDEEIEHELVRFCQVHEPNFNEVMFADRISFIVKKSRRYKLRLPMAAIPITTGEIEKIREVGNYRFEKVLFTMLVLGKYYKLTAAAAADASTTTTTTINKYYYVNDTINNILKLSHTSEKNNENILHSLYILGKIDYNKKLGTYVVKLFSTSSPVSSSNDIDTIFTTVTDLKHIPDFYPMYCSVCGKHVERKGRNHRLCGECWKERQKELWRENKRKIRNNNNQNNLET